MSKSVLHCVILVGSWLVGCGLVGWLVVGWLAEGWQQVVVVLWTGSHSGLRI